MYIYIIGICVCMYICYCQLPKIVWCINAQCHDINSASLTAARSLLLGLKALGPTPHMKEIPQGLQVHPIPSISFSLIFQVHKQKNFNLRVLTPPNESSGKSCDSPLCRVTVQWWVRCTPVISSRYLVHLQISPQIPSDQHIRTKYNQISITGQLWLRHPEAWYTKEMIRRNCLVPRKRYPFI